MHDYHRVSLLKKEENPHFILEHRRLSQFGRYPSTIFTEILFSQDEITEGKESRLPQL